MKENKNFIKGCKRTGGKYIQKGVGVQGVYIIYHDITNEFYIGKSCDINRRLSHHFGSLKRGENSNRKLQNLYDNSHKENFSFDYIEVSEEEGYKHVEDFMIDKYKNDARCLNASLPEGGWVKNPRIKTVRSLFEIEGEYYYNSLDISKKYGIARNTVSYRVESKNYERWKKLI